jgi:hypothetical protein
MAAPNIVNVATITGKTAVLAITGSATAIVTNSAASGKVYKINSLLIANIDGTASADITVDLYRSSTAYRLAYTIAVPNDASFIAIGKDAPIYLEEGDSLRLTASSTSKLEGVCSYEEIS